MKVDCGKPIWIHLSIPHLGATHLDGWFSNLTSCCCCFLLGNIFRTAQQRVFGGPSDGTAAWRFEIQLFEVAQVRFLDINGVIGHLKGWYCDLVLSSCFSSQSNLTTGICWPMAQSRFLCYDVGKSQKEEFRLFRHAFWVTSSFVWLKLAKTRFHPLISIKKYVSFSDTPKT